MDEEKGTLRPLSPFADEELALCPRDEASPSLAVSIAWMVVNTLATVGIVFTNKAIFSDASWRLSQLTFACFHFFVTWITLLVLASPALAFFVPRRVPLRHLLPLALAMCLNVILPNCSLAFSSITFYQVARVLLTPVVAILNFFLYGATLPPLAGLALIPACLGVGIVSYYDSLPAIDASIKTTSPLGVAFAMAGVLASSLYTVWIASYHKKLQMSSMQLLYSQAPMASFMLLYIIPFLDTLPDPSRVSASRWLMVMLVCDSLWWCDGVDKPSPEPLPLSSTYHNSSSSHIPAPCRAPSLVTSRRAPLCASDGSCLAGLPATGLWSACFLLWLQYWCIPSSCWKLASRCRYRRPAVAWLNSKGAICRPEPATS